MFQATMKIYETLKADDLKVFTDETEDQSYVSLQFGIKNGGSYRIRFISRDNDNDVAVRVFEFLSLEEDQVPRILPALNRLNNKYRFFKFVCDDENDINIEYDFTIGTDNPAASAKEIVVRLVRIIDEAYPELMRALWS